MFRFDGEEGGMRRSLIGGKAKVRERRDEKN